MLNERLVRVNHAFPIVRDCLEAIGASKCEVMSVLDLRDAYHTLPLAEESQKYCGLTPYYGSPTYVYLRMGMGMSCSPALWQQFVHIIWEQLPNKERYKIIMDDILIFSTRQQHWEDLENLFHVLIKFGLKISPHKCQLFRDKLVYMGLEFLIKDRTAHYTAMRDKCDAIRNMKAPKPVKECRTFCGMVNFLSTFCKNLRQLLIPIYELTKKHARFTWTDKHQKAFDEIKQLLVKPPVLRMVSGNGFFRLESDTSRTAAGATLYQWQNNEWVLVGYHSKRLPDAVRNYGVTELELTGLLANIHGFEQKLNNNYFEAIVDHKAIDYLIKSKHEPTSTRLVTLLDRLNRYTFDLKYLEGSKLKVSDALSRLYSKEKHKISDVIPLNFLLHFTDYQLHKESDELANKLYAHKRTKLSTKPRRNYDRQAKHSAEAMWAHFASVAVHPSQLRITGYPRAYDMHIIKLCCCRQLQVDWQNIILCDLDRNIIKLSALGKISLWSTNDLESIEANIPYQIWVYGRVLDLVIPLEIKDDVHITDHRLYSVTSNPAA